MYHVKANNIKIAEEIVKSDPFIVYEYDDCKQTALHWAVKRNFTKMTKILLKNHSRVDF